MDATAGAAEGGKLMYIPDCDTCEHHNECSIKKALKEARETIFNIGREQAGRNDFILDGKLVKPKEDDNA